MIPSQFEYRPLPADSSLSALLPKAQKLYKNFVVMKREWEMVGLVLLLLESLAPLLTTRDDVSAVLRYLTRSRYLHIPCKALANALDKQLVYNATYKVHTSQFNHNHNYLLRSVDIM